MNNFMETRSEPTSPPSAAAEGEEAMRLSHRLVALHIGGVVLLIAVVLSTALWISDRHNRLALDSSHKLVANELSVLRTTAFTSVKDYSLWDQGYTAAIGDDRAWLYSSIGSSVTELGTFDLVMIGVPGGPPAFGWVSGSPEGGETGLLSDDLSDAILGLLDGPGAGSASTRTLIAEFESAPWIFAVSRMTPVDGAPDNVNPQSLPWQVHGYRITLDRLTRIGQDIFTANLSVGPRIAPGKASVPIMDYAGKTISHAVWDAPRPGAEILRKAAFPLSIALGVATAISAFSSLYAIRSARRLEWALIAAKAADRVRTEFLSNVSHELRTPMNGVLGATQLLATTELTGEQREFVDLLASSANAQMSLITDLIDLSRIDSGNRRLVATPFDPVEIMAEVIGMMRVVAKKKGLRLDTDLEAAQDLILVGDAQAFRQILTNLLGNAVKFTDEGSVTVAASFREIEARFEVVLRVADTGPGIPEDALTRVFERFFQVDGSMSRVAEGTGLGLAISQKLAQSMGGVIDVSSTEGQGSTFTFTARFDRLARSAEARDAA